MSIPQTRAPCVVPDLRARVFVWTLIGARTPMPRLIPGPAGLDESTGQDVVEAAAGAFGAVTSIEVSADRGFAFVEFESESQSGVAMNGLQNFKITPTNLMKITYAKR